MGAWPTTLPPVLQTWQLVAEFRQEEHFQSQGLHWLSKVLNGQVLRQVGLAASQKAHVVVAPRGLQPKVVSAGTYW